jgi:hypothetical protein
LDPEPVCPDRGSSRQALIVYGLPEFTDQLRARLESGPVVLGTASAARTPSEETANMRTGPADADRVGSDEVSLSARAGSPMLREIA